MSWMGFLWPPLGVRREENSVIPQSNTAWTHVTPPQIHFTGTTTMESASQKANAQVWESWQTLGQKDAMILERASVLIFQSTTGTVPIIAGRLFQITITITLYLLKWTSFQTIRKHLRTKRSVTEGSAVLRMPFWTKATAAWQSNKKQTSRFLLPFFIFLRVFPFQKSPCFFCQGPFRLFLIIRLIVLQIFL